MVALQVDRAMSELAAGWNRTEETGPTRVLECHGAGAARTIVIELRPRRSLAGDSLRNFVSFTCALILVPSLLCCLLGLWGVLPFALLEIAVFAFILRRNTAQAEDREFITIDAAHIIVGCRQRCQEHTVELNRYWSRVRVSDRAEVRIESRGRSVKVGAFLADSQRHALAARLRGLIGQIGQLPALPDEARPKAAVDLSLGRK
jgi:uncharacterized membrane protein